MLSGVPERSSGATAGGAAGAWSSLRPKAEMTFLLTSSWFFNGSKADILAALTGVTCFAAGSAATTLPSRPSTDSLSGAVAATPGSVGGSRLSRRLLTLFLSSMSSLRRYFT